MNTRNSRPSRLHAKRLGLFLAKISRLSALLITSLCSVALLHAQAPADPNQDSYEVTDSFGKHRFQSPPQRVVVTDWTVLQQMLDLGIVPIGAPEVEAYRYYVGSPALPESVVDIGRRLSPSLAKIRALEPELIILGTGQKSLSRQLSRIAKVMYYKSFSKRYRGNGEKSRLRFEQIAALFQQHAQAKTKLADMDAAIASAKLALQQHYGKNLPTVLIGRFSSERKFLLYGANSLPVYSLNSLGIKTNDAIPVKGSDWGEVELSVKALANYQADYLLVLSPLVDGAMQGDVWQSLAWTQASKVRVLPTLWSYGGALSVGATAKAVAQALISETAD